MFHWLVVHCGAYGRVVIIHARTYIIAVGTQQMHSLALAQVRVTGADAKICFTLGGRGAMRKVGELFSRRAFGKNARCRRGFCRAVRVLMCVMCSRARSLTWCRLRARRLRTCRCDRNWLTRAIAHPRKLNLEARATRGCGARVVTVCGVRSHLRATMRTRARVTGAGIGNVSCCVCVCVCVCVAARKIGPPAFALAFTASRVCHDRAQATRATFTTRQR